MAKYQIQSNLSEKQIEKDVSTFLGWISPIGLSPFRFIDVSEELTGADAQFDSVFPLYLQFKKSNGLQPISKVPASNRLNRSKLEDIRIFRDNLGLDDDPTLYFELRRKANNAVDFQHNILLEYANTGYSQAFYIAPLTLNKQIYSDLLFDSATRFRSSPFSYDYIAIHQRNWVSYLGFVPFLKENISIIPHERVSTHEHYYSFSQNGTDIAWHSPTFLKKTPSRLSDELKKILKEKDGFSTLERLAENIKGTTIMQNLNISTLDMRPLEIIKIHGDLLWNIYDICQILITNNGNDLAFKFD
jgi:hypothetical protein